MKEESGVLPEEGPVGTAVGTAAGTAADGAAGGPVDGQDIAVVGLSLRLPGARNPEEFWEHLAAGRSLISEVPERRWRKEDHLGNPRREFNKTNSVWGGFVDDADCFDAEFFHVSPREARSMDPQQRMALEMSWQALEDAGYRADRVAGSRTGVFMGVCHWDYAELIEKEVSEVDAYYPTGAAYAIIANRVSHHFDFRGPSVVNDTACASSLVAVQQAVQALQSGDCDHALAGGVNLTWSPRHFIAFAKAGMLSPDGLCRAFDADANGYVRGEGGGVVLLKRAADARRDGDPVHAVIKGIGSNHGGRTSSLTVTNPAAQAELIAGIYRRAGIAPESVSYIETHGPGTPVGDPIEVSGLKRAFAQLGEGREAEPSGHRCGIGSVKTNIGHLEGAAGIAGMLKVILAMRHRKLPATVNFRRLNPLITLDGSPLYVVDRLTDWETDGDGTLRAGVSSFGFGGTNAHVVLEAPGGHAAEVTDAEAVADADVDGGPDEGPDEGVEPRVLRLPVSADDEARLRELCRSLAEWARARDAEGTAPPLADIARTLREGRVPMRERAVFRARSVAEWAEQLTALAEGTGGEPPAGCLRGRAEDGAGDGLDADDVAALTARWRERDEEEKFAAAWTRGLPVDWAQWPVEGRRVHLPGQVFQRTPHWFRPDEQPRGDAESAGGPAAQRDAASGPERGPGAPEPAEPAGGPGLPGEGVQDGQGWHFPLRFAATDPFVRDHLVEGSRIVPGVVALEAVTAAAARPAVAGARAGAAPHIRNAVWVRPLRVDDQVLETRLRLTPAGPESGGGYDWAVTDAAGTPYSSGRVEYADGPAPAATDLDALHRRHTRPVEVAGGYAALHASGIEHGPALRALHTLRAGPEGLLAELRLPAEPAAGVALQPAVLDSALLAVLALGAGGGDGTEGEDGAGWRRPEAPAVPFALDGLTAYAPTTATTWAWLRPAGGRRPGAADIDLFDERGRPCARLTGYTSRELSTGSPALREARVSVPAPGEGAAGEDAPATEATGELLEVTGRWTPAPLDLPAAEAGPAAAQTGGAAPVTVLNAALDADLVAASAARLGMDVEHLAVPRDAGDADAMKAAFAACYPHVRRLVGQSRRVLLVAPGAPDSPVFAPLAALLKTAHQENPSFHGTTVLLEGFDPRDSARFEQVVRTEAAAAAYAAGGAADEEVAHTADGRRLRHETAELPHGTTGESLLAEGGVYWITGGAGGIGLLLAERLCLRYGATVVLSGRSPSAPAADALASRLTRGTLVYRGADVTDQDSVDALVAAVLAEHGRIDGVFHAAGVLDDGYLTAKPLAGTEAVLAPKVDGVTCVDRATRAAAPGFLLVFGSVAGAFGNAAQAGYAAANAYLDAFAARRQAAGLTTRAVDWPLWAEGGMRVDDASLKYLRKRTGTVPLPSGTGLDALERALHTGSPVRRVVLYGDRPALRVYAGLDRPQVMGARSASASAPGSSSGSVSAARGEGTGTSRAALSDAELLVRTQDFLREQFAEVTLQDAEQIHPEEKLETYGIESISIVDLTSRLEDVFGSLPKTLFFEYVDLKGVAEYFVAEHRARLTELFAPEEPQASEAAEPAVAAPAPVPAPPAPTAAPGTSVEAVPTSAPASVPASAPTPRPASAGNGDIAVVGMAGRYPGADTLEEFWELLSEGRHSFEPVPSSRWPHGDLYFDERDVLGKTTVRTGTFLRDVDAFDPRYFSISQRDAELLSPEVRLFLQAGVTALEDAGYSKETLRRRYDGDVGVLVGSMNNSYAYYGFENMLMRGTATSGSEVGVMANMLSYYYGFTGPSMFVDTMCSSSSACVHQALSMLRGGECRMVVVGGINLMLHPYDLIATSQAHFTTKSAEVVRSYGLGADGTILGEGVGTLVLKPLAEAVADGDHVYGVIKGSGMTNAGVRNGFTVPSPQQQARAIERALDDAAVDARTVSYLEGHGSATSLGDPIEIKGASLAFGRDTRDVGYCAIGSVKSNVAHLLSGSGLVGLTKVLLQLRHRTLAPSLHSETLSPAIDFGSTPFVVQRERAEWRRPVVHGAEVPRRAGVTSIGAGGINVHLVVEEFDGTVNSSPDDGGSQLLVFSAMTPQALGTVLRDAHRHVADEAPALNALAYTLQTGKNELPCRLAFVAHGTADAEARLAALAAADWTSGAPALPDGVRFTESTLRKRRSVAAADVERALAQTDLAELAGYWISGAAVDWDLLWPSGTRPAKLALPAYPFEKVRCWYPGFDDAPSVLRPLVFTRRGHPWVGVNRSDLHGVRFALELTGDELLDYVHTVGRTRRFTTVALLDGALAFARLAGLDGALRLRDARWAELPSPGDATEVFEWRLALSGEGASGDGASGRGASGGGASGAGGGHRVELWQAERGTLHFSAEVVPATALAPGAVDARPADAAALLAAPVTLDGDAFYAALGDAGVDARPYARVVTGVTEAGGRRLLVRVAEPAMCQDPHKQHVSIPAWVLAGLAQGVQHATGRPRTTALRAAALYGEDLTDTRALLLEPVAEATFRITFLDGDGRALGAVEDAEFTAGTLPLSLEGGAVPVRAGLPGAARPSATASASVPVPAPALAAAPAAPAVPVEPAAEADADAGGALVAVLRETVADLLKFELDEIDLDTHFHAYGFESIALARLASELNGLLGTDLSPVVFFECPDIRSLAAHLRERYDAETAARAVRGTGGGGTDAAQAPTPVPAPAVRAAPAAAPPAPLSSAEPVSDHEADYPGAVAVVGVAGRFPGAPDADTFWQRLRAGDDLIGEYPGDRFDERYSDVVARSDFPKFAGVLDDVDRFDAGFFNLSRLEAELMDPQHRLALETVWAALEDGGYAPGRLPENTGVYVGVSGSDYHHLLNASGVAPDGFTATGNAHSMLANRISFVLDVHGPSEPVDTACSSSLVALHRAVESIRTGRCDMALAGGVNLLLSVDTFAATQMAGMLSPDGRCKTFSADADGYVRAEGVAAVLLKPLERALADGDPVWGVVRGSAENHGGRAGSLTAPNAVAQTALIREAMRGTDPDSVGYVEAHGTGTGLGDPVEVGALDSAYRALRSDRGRVESGTAPVALGSVKTNIGHAESAAGLAGVLKVLLAMRHGELPPTLHCDRLNPHLPLSGGGFEVVREVRRWEPRLDADGRPWPLRAGVSSFGFGGANAHVVLEAAPAAARAQAVRETASRSASVRSAHGTQGAPQVVAPQAVGPQIVAVSARDGERLRIVAERLRDFLRREHDAGRAPATADLARTLQTGREAMEARLAFVAEETGEVLDVLDRFLKGEEPGGWHTGALRRSRGAGVRRDRAQDPRVTRALRDGDLDAAAALWCEGALVDWQALHPPGERRTVRLPSYPFARERYWVPTDGAAPPPETCGSGGVEYGTGSGAAQLGDGGGVFDAGARAAVLDAVLDGRADPDDLART